MAIAKSARISLRTLCASMLLACALVAPQASARTDYTDLWWNPVEAGWGLNLVQAQNFLFATFFVYGPGNQPLWYTGEMTRDASGAYAGPLFATTGTYFASSPNPSHKSARQVGDVTFAPATSTTGTLVYTVDGITVTKTVQRQTLQTIPLGASYLGGLVSKVAGCANPAANGTTTRSVQLLVTQVGADSKLSMDFSSTAGPACKLNGAYVQQGQLYTLPQAIYACSDGLSANAHVSELRATARGIEGQWTATLGGGCTETVEFSAVAL